jgi:hypothetical protein
MVRAISAFLEFCYLVRRSQIDSTTLDQIQAAVTRFHQERQIFKETGVRTDFSLPRQHSLMHYRFLIQQFGAPNGLCSSITESRHITAVKEPWRRSNRNEAIGQMLLTNQRLDKLISSRVDFAARGMLEGPLSIFSLPVEPAPEPPSSNPRLGVEDTSVGASVEDAEAVEGITSLGDVKLARHSGESRSTLKEHYLLNAEPAVARHYPSMIDQLAVYLGQPRLIDHIRRFIYDQFHPDAETCGMDVQLDLCPEISSQLRVKVFHSATSTYYAPSDLSGIGGMHRERIRAMPRWKGGPGRYDCIYVEKDADADGFCGLHVARVKLFFSFHFQLTTFSCALVEWFSTYGDSPCEDTGLWRVEPDYDARGQRMCSVIHVDTILRLAHLIGVSGPQFLPTQFTHHDSLDAFRLFYVNKYADHHAHEIAF